MTIGQLAHKTNLSVQAIRYYERIKLIPKPKIKESGYRSYSSEYADRLNFILRAKELKFSLKEIRSMINFKQCEDMNELAVLKLKEADEKINSYKELKTRLTKLLNRCENKGTIDNCIIIKTLTKKGKTK